MNYKNITQKKMIRRTIIFLCSLFLACEQAPAPEEETPPSLPPEPAASTLPTSAHIQITNEADLKKIGVSTSRKGYYELQNDIVLNDWTPLAATSATQFAGAFDGGGHTITINSTKGGLFAYTKMASIWNLNIAGTITVHSDAGSAAQVGGIAGNADWTHFTNCASTVNITVTAHGHNSSAGSIVGTMKHDSMIKSCAASGNVTLQTGDADNSLMIYTGGLAGYVGDGSASGDTPSGCLVTKSSYSGTVIAISGYPYVGGIVGYNYSSSNISECYTSGAVIAEGKNLPYAGGVAGYNSRSSVIGDSYSTANVTATAASKQALAGGITGATAAGAATTKCYATGTVTATIKGDSTADSGGSLGVPPAANAGGISGAIYYNDPSLPKIENCAALNSSVTAVDTATGGTLNAYRISAIESGTFTNNIANAAMTITGGANADNIATGKDGADKAINPAQSVFQSTLGWNFTTVWKMGANNPMLQWQTN
jgi:hypothetical protein